MYLTGPIRRQIAVHIPTALLGRQHKLNLIKCVAKVLKFPTSRIDGINVTSVIGESEI